MPPFPLRRAAALVRYQSAVSASERGSDSSSSAALRWWRLSDLSLAPPSAMMSIGGGEVGSTKELSSYNTTEIAGALRTTTAKNLSLWKWCRTYRHTVHLLLYTDSPCISFKIDILLSSTLPNHGITLNDVSEDAIDKFFICWLNAQRKRKQLH